MDEERRGRMEAREEDEEYRDLLARYCPTEAPRRRTGREKRNHERWADGVRKHKIR